MTSFCRIQAASFGGGYIHCNLGIGKGADIRTPWGRSFRAEDAASEGAVGRNSLSMFEDPKNRTQAAELKHGG